MTSSRGSSTGSVKGSCCEVSDCCWSKSDVGEYAGGDSGGEMFERAEWWEGELGDTEASDEGRSDWGPIVEGGEEWEGVGEAELESDDDEALGSMMRGELADVAVEKRSTGLEGPY